jgi:hypothetical protein
VIAMLLVDKRPQGFAPTQLVGGAIRATVYVLPTAKGTFYLARAMGFDRLGNSLSSVLIVTGICWLLLFLPTLTSGPPSSAQWQPRWLNISRTLADPTVSIGDKFKATFTDWLSLLIIVSTLIWIASSIFTGVSLLP